MTEVYDRFNHHEGGLNVLSGTLSTSRVYIYKILAMNNSGDPRYFQVFDTGSVPVEPNIPRSSYRVAQSSSLALEFLSPRQYYTGAVYAWSSTYGTLTSGLFTELSVEIEYQQG